ncbi:TPA: DUF4406 domain-containing protein [Enterobacter ludwigii]|nr:DUF4406 domain-containing protein [Enterobacter ludwigii]HDR2591111.1 DUF4406 domain-containing protein [Enterobacter ludwigii]HDR2598694.1 DUF4406 domain-containing protein [Enterobacter ludwigii]
MKIYITGPMSGLPEFNRPAFFKAAEEISARGHCVLNPAILPDGLTQHEYMDICQAMVRSADAIFMLNRWENSRGALAELHQARKLGLLIIFQKPSATLQDINIGWLQYLPEGRS